MGFDELKKYHLKKLEEALKKKEVDEPIIPLLNVINSYKNYFTSSSCAGRIVLMYVGKTKPESKFLYKTHYFANFDVVWKILLENYKKYGNIWFKQEPFIIHIYSRTLKDAIKILNIAQSIGLKHSGIISIKEEYVVIEIQGNERIETILAKDGRLLIEEDYLRVLIEEANKKLERTRERMGKLFVHLNRNRKFFTNI